MDTIVGTAGNDTINALTVDAAGAAKGTFTGFDSIDGGSGNDTFNIFSDGTATINVGNPSNASVKNVETININNTGAGFGTVDASKFVGATAINQVGVASAVTNLAAGTTAGFKDLTATALSVTAATAATTANVALTAAKGVATTNVATLAIDGAALTGVTVTGTLAETTPIAAAKAAVAEVFVATFAGGATAGNTIVFNTITYTSVGGLSATAEAAAFAAAYNLPGTGAWTAVASGATVTFTNTIPGGVFAPNIGTNDFSGTQAAAVTAAAPTTEGAAIVAAVVAANLALNVTVAKDAQASTVNTAVASTLTIENAAGSTKDLLSVDASASTGAITYANADAQVATIKTGAGADVVTVRTATLVAATGVTAVDASVSTGAGIDTITVATTGTGTTTVDAGAGNDIVNVTGRGTGKLNVNLGDGNDVFTSSVAVNGTDVIDAGAGIDTLALSLVGSANIAAFSNFDVFNVAGLAKTLDVDILAAKNTVTEFVGSATAGTSAVLTNIGAGVGFRAIGDMGTTNTLTLTQKTAGALTVTLDADEAAGTADTTIDVAGAKVIATNATSLKAVFDTSYLASITGETTVGDNVSTLNLQGVAATLNVVSGGANANNVMVYDDIAPAVGAVTVDALTSVMVSGDRALDLSFTTSTKLATVDASTQTGGLTFSLANLKDGGNVTLGSGKDVITVTSASTKGGVETITGFEKAAVIAISTSTVAADVTAKAAAIADADVLALGTAAVADALVVTGGAVADKGVLTFTGTGPADLSAAIGIADLAANAIGEAVVFEYIGNSYVFVQGNDDIVVQLVGITGVTNFAEVGTTNSFFIV